jgi:hypothetical protein
MVVENNNNNNNNNNDVVLISVGNPGIYVAQNYPDHPGNLITEGPL